MRLFSLALLILHLSCPALALELALAAHIVECKVITRQRSCIASPQLRSLLTFLNVNYDISFESVVDAAQREWLREKGVERWQMVERFEEKRPQLLAFFSEMGFVHAVHSKRQRYDYGVVHGATIQRVLSRIEWLKSEWQKGVRFDAIAILSGERALDEDLEMPKILEDWRCCEVLPRNEIEMIRWVWARVKLPEEMKRLPVTLVDSKASDWRAHTADTVDSWLEKGPKAGSILAVSNQPFVSYQDMTMRNKIPSQFTLETIGEGANGDTMNVVYLDNLARLLFELEKWTKRN